MRKHLSAGGNSLVRVQIKHRMQAINVGKPSPKNWTSLHHIAALGSATVEQLLADAGGEVVLPWLAATEECAFS